MSKHKGASYIYTWDIVKISKNPFVFHLYLLQFVLNKHKNQNSCNFHYEKVKMYVDKEIKI